MSDGSCTDWHMYLARRDDVRHDLTTLVGQLDSTRRQESAKVHSRFSAFILDVVWSVVRHLYFVPWKFVRLERDGSTISLESWAEAYGSRTHPRRREAAVQQF